MSTLKFLHEYIILDACCAINLYASKYMTAILKAHQVSFALAEYVHTQETLEVYASHHEERNQGKERIDFQSLIDDGLLLIAAPQNEEESRDALNFMSDGLQEGEAITGAIAKGRNWSIGTDDVRAISYLKKELPHLQIVTTLELVRHWSEFANPSPDVVLSVLTNIRGRANYAPGPKHLLYPWWKTYQLEK